MGRPRLDGALGLAVPRGVSKTSFLPFSLATKDPAPAPRPEGEGERVRVCVSVGEGVVRPTGPGCIPDRKSVV